MAIADEVFYLGERVRLRSSLAALGAGATGTIVVSYLGTWGVQFDRESPGLHDLFCGLSANRVLLPGVRLPLPRRCGWWVTEHDAAHFEELPLSTSDGRVPEPWP